MLVKETGFAAQEWFRMAERIYHLTPVRFEIGVKNQTPK
jgi:hypothetical protein